MKIRDRRTRGWLWVQNEIVDRWMAKMGPAGMAVYMVLSRYADQHDQTCYPSHATIATRMGVSRRTVIRALDVLEELGLVDVERRFRQDTGAQTTNVYYLVDPPSDNMTQPPVPICHTPYDTSVTPNREQERGEQDQHEQERCAQESVHRQGVVEEFLRRKNASRRPWATEIALEADLVADHGLERVQEALPEAMDRVRWADSFTPVAEAIRGILDRRRHAEQERQQREQEQAEKIARQAQEKRRHDVWLAGWLRRWRMMPADLQAKVKERVRRPGVRIPASMMDTMCCRMIADSTREMVEEYLRATGRGRR